MKYFILLTTSTFILSNCALITVADTAVDVITAPVDILLGVDESEHSYDVEAYYAVNDGE